MYPDHRISQAIIDERYGRTQRIVTKRKDTRS